MVNYAHRGASEYAPENTLSAFYLGLLQGANGIELDVQRTKDGVIVVFHDDTVDRVTDGTGRVSELTFRELKKLKVYGNSVAGFYDRILSLEEFLYHFASYDIELAVELKGAKVEFGTLSMVQRVGILNKVTFTSFEYDYIKKVKEYNPEARVGWLVKEVNEEVIQKILNIGGEEVCPLASRLTSDSVSLLKENNLGIRAWGVSNVSLMEQMCKLGVDGMTVNFPDRLAQFLSFNFE